MRPKAEALGYLEANASATAAADSSAALRDDKKRCCGMTKKVLRNDKKGAAG
jgi:hypothetical protein